MPDPTPDRRVAVAHGEHPREPVAGAFAAPTAPEHQDQSGSRPRPRWLPSAGGGRVDPLAVMRDALAAEDEEQDIADEATRPGLFSRLTDRSRTAASRRRGRGDTPSGEEPLVAPEVEAAAADSADPKATPDTSAAGEGWVHHDGSDATGHEGWLYHYADGTIVDADGTVYEYAATPAAPEPEPSPQPAVDPEPVTMPTQDVRPEPEHHSEHEASHEPEEDAAPTDEHEAAPEHEAGTEDEPAQVDPAPVTMLTDHEQPSADQDPRPEPEPGHAAVDPEPVAMLSPEPERDPEHSDDAEHQTAPDTDHQPDDEDHHQEERGSRAVPAFVEYSSGDAPRYVAGAVLLVASVVAVLVLVSAIADSSGSGVFVAALLALLAAGASWVLTRWEPTVVTVRDGRLEVTRGDDGDYFDLRDPATEVHLDGNPSSPTWRARFSEPEGSRATLRRTQVKARQFVDIVEHHRAHAADKSPVRAD